MVHYEPKIKKKLGEAQHPAQTPPRWEGNIPPTLYLPVLPPALMMAIIGC